MGVSTSMFRAQFLLALSTEKQVEFLFFFSSMNHIDLNSFWLSTSDTFQETKLWSSGHNLGRFLSNSCTGLGCVWGETPARPHIDNTEMWSMVAATHARTQHTHMRSERLNEDVHLHGHMASRGRCSPLSAVVHGGDWGSSSKAGNQRGRSSKSAWWGQHIQTCQLLRQICEFRANLWFSIIIFRVNLVAHS